MSDKVSISRRTALMGAAALPLAAGLSGQAQAQAALQGAAQAPLVKRLMVGGMEVTAMMAGTRTVENPKGIFGMNVGDSAFEEASAAANIPTDKAQFFFTPTLVNTGSELILFDTGLNGAGISAAVAAAGYTTDQVSHVVLTHMHGDHIGGLMTDGAPTFANAAYVTGQVEFDAWAGMENENFEAKVRPLADRMSFIGDGGSVTSGITGLASYGHTPGHMGYMLESEGKQLMLFADLANHYVWSLAYPDWEVRFDMDKAAAAQSRRKVLGMLAADKVPFIGYHMPFPAVGYAETRGDGFHYVPHSYQLML